MKVGLRQLLAQLINRTDTVAQILFWAIVFWVCTVIDTCKKVSLSSGDPLAALALIGVRGRASNI